MEEKTLKTVTGLFRRGDGEFVSFTVICVIVCTLVIIMAAFLQLSAAANSLTKAVNVAARSAAICLSMEDAQEQAQIVAESAITDASMGNVTAEVEYAGGSDSWVSGAYLKVTVSADVDTLEPYFLSGRREKSVVVCVEGSASGTYGYSDSEMQLIYAIVSAECNVSYEGALAVITCACNRAESTRYAGYGADPLSQLTASGQFDGYGGGYYRNWIGRAPADVIQAVDDALGNGTRNHRFLSFRGYYVAGSWECGGNYYFDVMD